MLYIFFWIAQLWEVVKSNLAPLFGQGGRRNAFASMWLTNCGHPSPTSTALCSTSITETSLLLRGNPPLCLASALSFLWGLNLNFSLYIETTGSHVPHKSLYQDHATFMPGAEQTVDRYPLCLSRDQVRTSVLTPPIYFRHLISGSLPLIFQIHTCHDPISNAHHADSLPAQFKVV